MTPDRHTIRMAKRLKRKACNLVVLEEEGFEAGTGAVGEEGVCSGTTGERCSPDQRRCSSGGPGERREVVSLGSPMGGDVGFGGMTSSRKVKPR